MNEFERIRRDCRLGVKTWHNLSSSLSAFERLCHLVDLNDHLILSSLFYMGVIKYAKPFLNNDSGSGLISYPIKTLRKESGFRLDIHKHLVSIRNTLIAHDDFKEVFPTILTTNMRMGGTDFDIIISITMSNKCISHPSDLSVVAIFKEHVSAALDGTVVKLMDDLARFRKCVMDDPTLAESGCKNSRLVEKKMSIPPGGRAFVFPDLSSDPWLDVDEPDFSGIHNGFRYEEIKFQRDFSGPEEIILPNGDRLVLTPSKD